jgi:hypothetical protein
VHTLEAAATARGDPDHLPRRVTSGIAPARAAREDERAKGRCDMSKTTTLVSLVTAACAAVALASLWPPEAGAHCDTMDGPVVAAAKLALEKGDATPVLKWVAKDREDELKAAFARTLAARKSSPEARDVADAWFFETLVRVHRAGEGEPYTGLRPAGAATEPGIVEADQALASGDVDELAKGLASAVEHGVRHRFERAAEAKARADKSVDAGREYVAAYVEFLHYVERVHAVAAGTAHHGTVEHGEHK